MSKFAKMNNISADFAVKRDKKKKKPKAPEKTEKQVEQKEQVVE
jgi:hypothetical protein